MRIIFESVLMLFTKNIKISPCLLKLQLAKVGASFEIQCRMIVYRVVNNFVTINHVKTLRYNTGTWRTDRIPLSVSHVSVAVLTRDKMYIRTWYSHLIRLVSDEYLRHW